MINYIRRIAEQIVNRPRQQMGNPPAVSALLRALVEELNRLDPRDFLPDARYQFVLARIEARRFDARVGGGQALTIQDYEQLQRLAQEITNYPDKYGGEGSRAETRSFGFIADADLRSIVERDYREISLILLPGGAWKSCVVMAGSILEAILSDVLVRDATTKARAETSSKAPFDRSGQVRDLAKGEWRLTSLIDVAVDIGLLPSSRADSIDQILRDYRNYIHPKKEIRSGYPCTEAEAYLAKGALDSVCNHLETII